MGRKLLQMVSGLMIYSNSMALPCPASIDLSLYIKTQPKNAAVNYPGTIARVSNWIWNGQKPGCKNAWNSSVRPTVITRPNPNGNHKSNQIVFKANCTNPFAIQSFGLRNAVVTVYLNNNGKAGKQIFSCTFSYNYPNGCSPRTSGQECSCFPLSTSHNCKWYNGYNSNIIGMNYHKKGRYFTVWQTTPTNSTPK